MSDKTNIIRTWYYLDDGALEVVVDVDLRHLGGDNVGEVEVAGLLAEAGQC